MRFFQSLQKPYDKQDFCNFNGPGRRSAIRPTNVHRLRPADIDVIGAIGDSMTAANGALSTNVFHMVTEDRSVSWSAGGNGNWKTFLTLPNLIKAYNPRLTGYSYSYSGNSYAHEESARFNVAEPGSFAEDTLRQAKLLINRMKSDKQVNMQNDWKLITIMTGTNDICYDVCHKNNKTNIHRIIETAQNNLEKLLRHLQYNLPRTLVNLVVPIGNLKILICYIKVDN